MITAIVHIPKTKTSQTSQNCRDILTAPTAPNPAPVRERPPRRRDYNYFAWLLSKGYDAETALNWTDRITRELSADAGADMGGNSHE